MNTSIQEFYKRQPPATKDQVGTLGDGFTPDEVAAALNPASLHFDSKDYVPTNIGDLQTGLSKVSFSGRVVNWRDIFGKSKAQASARGWQLVLIHGAGGIISVKLYYSQQPYRLRLGQLVTIHTNFVADASSPTHKVNLAYVLTACSIFPGRDASCHIKLHDHDEHMTDYRVPHLYEGNTDTPLPGLMNLKAFLAGGNEVPDAKILVCVKSISGRKEVKLKNGGETAIYQVGIMDDTADCMLKLWGNMGDSVREWEATKTLLLISSPGEKVEFRGGVSIDLGYFSMVDVDPEFRDAVWLRNWMANRMKKEGVKQDFPEGVFDVEAAVCGVNRTLYTISEVDDWARDLTHFTGFLSLVLTDVHLFLLRSRNMLMVTECCGIPIYCNTPTTNCKHCDKALNLSLNPKVLGVLIDESGSLASGRLLWSDRAWKDLWGRSVEELIDIPPAELRLLEQRIIGLRFTLVFGWEKNVGRLTVLAVRS